MTVRGIAAAVAVVAAVAVAGCGAGTDQGGRAERETKTAPAKTTPADDTPTKEATGEPMDAADLGPEQPEPVSFTDAVAYKDGLKVEVSHIGKARVSEFSVGDGDAKVGDTMTVFSLRVSNKGTKAFDAGLVSPSVTYGDAGVEAEGIFDENSGDGFSGVVLPGKAMTAKWAFVIPADGLSDVTMQVDLGDPEKGPAIFSGPVKAGA